MVTNPLVSIIIPCYNQANYLKESVLSAIEQTYSNIEIIIINDGSTDNTNKIAMDLQTKYPKKIQYISQKNKGVSEARNNAISQSKGQYILPLDADDMIDKEMVNFCLNTLIKYDVDIVYTDIQFFGVKNHIDHKKPFSKNNLLYQNSCSATSLYKKNMWEKLGGYSKNMKEGYEDWEFWIHAYKQNFKFKLLSKPLLLYRTHEVSRNTAALEKDTYLKAKIVMHHPELYINPYVQEAMRTIKEVDKLADLYFYWNKDIIDTEETWLRKVGDFITNNTLNEKQVINIKNKKIGLCSLDLFQNEQSLHQIYTEMDVSYLLFYAPVLYNVVELFSSMYCWKKDIGIIKSTEDSFPFVPRSERESKEKQLIAYQLLNRYKIEVIEPHIEKKIAQYQKTIKNRDETIKNKNLALKNRDETIKNKNLALKNRDEIIKNKNKIIEAQKLHINNQTQRINQYQTAIISLTRIKTITNPIKKYIAYKNLIKIIKNDS